MSIASVNFTSVTTPATIVKDAVMALREARVRVIRAFALLDQMRDSGAVTAYMAGKLGTADATEAGKVFDELSSLLGYVSSEDPNTLGAAVIQCCAKFGI